MYDKRGEATGRWKQRGKREQGRGKRVSTHRGHTRSLRLSLASGEAKRGGEQRLFEHICTEYK